ncbi:MAG: HlyD family efflux transporter periplasmic adaptor subunit [Bacillota bacterium]|nr:HlyD family efflux transporter periplasmic adaptor subunit [Bacillota bacterium]
MKKNVKRILWIVVIIVVFAFGLYSYLQPLHASLLEVNPRAIERGFTESGKLIPSVEQDLFSPNAGKVLTILAEQGEQVAAGDPLIEMDTKEINLQLAQLEGQLTSVRGQESIALRQPSSSHAQQQLLAIRQAEILLDTARMDFERFEELYGAGAISQKSFEDAQRGFLEAKNLLLQQKLAMDILNEQPLSGTEQQFTGLVESLQAQISLLEYQKNQCTILAPFNGIVREVHVKEGAVLAPGTPLLTIFQPEKYRIEVFLLSGDIEHIQPGMPVSITYEGSIKDHFFDGRVSAIAPAAVEIVSALGLVEQRVKVSVELLGDTGILRPGYEMDVKLVTHREKEKLAVPKVALFVENKEDFLWVVRDGRAVIQQVMKGMETDESVVIEEGLQHGDLVIRNPRMDGLAEGKRVVAQ